jgi:formylmethanofuran dehydrogenase subunit E
MTGTALSKDLIEKTTAFHGHWCPGLAVGIRVSEAALAEVGKDGDEDIVAVVESDNCAVDAIQFITGCTFGKGNLIHKDYGKNAFSFYRRRDGKATRVILKPTVYGEAAATLGKLGRKMREEGLTPEEEKVWRETRAAVSSRIMESDLHDVFEIKAPDRPIPEKARIMTSLVCESCGEAAMETRTRRFQDQVLCIPCFEAMEKR